MQNNLVKKISMRFQKDGDIKNPLTIWIASVDILPLKCEEECVRLLSPEEKEKYEKFLTGFDKKQYLFTRILLRSALCSITDNKIPFSAWRFNSDEYGNPGIDNQNLQSVMNVTISHSEKVIAVAVCLDGCVGIDIEPLEQAIEEDSLRAVLAPEEIKTIEKIPDKEKNRNLIKLWTLKEAYAKMMGFGLSLDFKSFAIDLEQLSVMRSGEKKSFSNKGCLGTRALHLKEGLFQLSIAVDNVSNNTNRAEIYFPDVLPDSFLTWIKEERKNI